MKKTKIYAKGRGNRYAAFGYIEEGTVIVLAGSTISPSVGKKQNLKAERARNNPEVVSKDFTLLKDISFTSLSTAACFVAGCISNGNVVWKTEDGKSLERKEDV